MTKLYLDTFRKNALNELNPNLYQGISAHVLQNENDSIWIFLIKVSLNCRDKTQKRELLTMDCLKS